MLYGYLAEIIKYMVFLNYNFSVRFMIYIYILFNQNIAMRVISYPNFPLVLNIIYLQTSQIKMLFK